MAHDWSDPQAVEAELARREREAARGAGGRPEPERVLRAVHAVLESQRDARADLARIARDLAAVRARLAQRENGTPAEGEAPGGPASAAATPEALEALRAAVAPLAEAVQGHTLEHRARQGYLSALGVELKDRVKDAETALAARFAEEASRVRGALEDNTAVVRRRRRRSRRFWLGLAGAVLVALLGCTVGGLWLQARYDLLPAHDPTRGWRDGIWNDYGLQLQDCILEARDSGRAVDCPIAPPK